MDDISTSSSKSYLSLKRKKNTQRSEMGHKLCRLQLVMTISAIFHFLNFKKVYEKKSFKKGKYKSI